ncbi:hypothetical protein Cgig2_008822 [Carnegiea gigantea]|uniref:Uncharacterized protein n=1 Tax=Carnegiea gigantea TaxID=171969 RepID=A0A9Q1GRH3_9CARY|nr:hypothetical protein Cgig2_008822 [Carnegiea gigantea]
MRNVYTSRKRSRKASSTTSKEEEVEDIWVVATEADKEGSTVMAVVVPVAAAGGPNDGVGGIYGTLGHSKEELLTRPNSPTNAAGDASIHQGGHNMCALVGAMHIAEEPITVRATDNLAIVHGTGPPLLRDDAFPFPCSPTTWCPSFTLFHCAQLWNFMFVSVPIHLLWFTRVCGFLYCGKPSAEGGCSQTYVLLLTCMQDGGWEQIDDVIVRTDATEEAASASGSFAPVAPARPSTPRASAIGYDCGMFLMICMDVLALRENTLCFTQDDMRALQDKYGPRPCPPPSTRTCDRYIQNIVEDNQRISYNVPRHTMTDAVASTYVVYHNHECGVPRYIVQV